MKEVTHLKNKKKTFLIVCVILLIVGYILYWLANRYLIEHVEIDNAITAEQSESTEQADADEEVYTSDEWHYESNKKSIEISKVVENDTTYFVADVELKNGETMLSAFAKNQFGNNIIEYTSEIASDNEAIFAINGDYYGFRDDGIIIRNGQLYRDVPARTGLAFYADGSMKTYDETKTSGEELLSEGVIHTFSFGPVLVENSEAISNFNQLSIDKNFGNRSIEKSNPRTGVGIIAPNHFVFVVVDGRSKNYSNGLTLEEFAQVFEDLGCTDAYNLDGGGSSTMYFMGKVVNNPLGKNKERGVSDILYLK